MYNPNNYRCDNCNSIRIDMLSGENTIYYCNNCHVTLPVRKLLPKPSLGVKPRFIFYEDRMREITEAIIRKLDWFKEHNTCAATLKDFELIADWARELQEIAEAEGKNHVLTSVRKNT